VVARSAHKPSPNFMAVDPVFNESAFADHIRATLGASQGCCYYRAFDTATLAKSERWYMSTQLPADIGCSWRANTWMPTNYYIFQGLRRYGYPEHATKLVDETTRLLRKSGNREYFCSETGEGRGLDPFWGWTLLGRFMPFENEHNLDPTTLE